MKVIRHPDNSIFLIRWSFKIKSGSIKIHLILNDDINFHSHPWDFKSIILFGGYIEQYWLERLIGNIYLSTIEKEEYKWLSINRKECEVKHLVKLRRLFGFKIPCLTIGFYGKKKQLCSLCKDLGYCKTNGKPI